MPDEETEYVQEPQTEAERIEFYNELQKDARILIPDFDDGKMEVVVPNIVKHRIQQPIVDANGIQVIDKLGRPLFEEKILSYQEGFKVKMIPVPMPRLHTSSLTTAFMNEFDKTYVESLYENYLTKWVYSMQKGKKMQMHLHKLRATIETVVDVSKGVDGKAGRLSKSTFKHGEQRTYVSGVSEKDEKPKGFLGGLMGGKPEKSPAQSFGLK